MDRIIFKVQMPKVTTSSDPSVLIYAEGRKYMCTLPAKNFVKIMGDSLKKYFYGFIDEDGVPVLDISEEAPKQEW